MKLDNYKTKYSEVYKIGTTKFRGAKLEIDFFDYLERFHSIGSKINKYQMQFSRKLFYDLRKIKDVRSVLKFLGKRSLADHIYPEDVATIVKEEGFRESVVKRQIIRPVIRRYLSYVKRPRSGPRRLPNFPIHIKDGYKGLEIYDDCVSIDVDNKLLIFDFWYKNKSKRREEPISIKYKTCGTMYKYEPFIKEHPGGYFILNKGKKIKVNGSVKITPRNPIYVAKVTIPVNWAFDPVSFLGIDINMLLEHLRFSRPINFFGEIVDSISKKHPCLDKSLKLEKILKKMNKDKKELSGTSKSKKRNKIKLIHKRHRLSYCKLATELIDYCERNKICLCIDDLACGSKTGSFGQDKLVSILVQLCENRSVPYVLVPTPYTTRICHVCGHLNNKVELGVSKFTCEGCLTELDRNSNAAKVIEERGKSIWENGFYKTMKLFEEKYNHSMTKE